MKNIGHFKHLAIAFSLALVATGCANSSTPYQPISASNKVSGGYSDARLSDGVYRVTFAGNSFTSREDVEGSLLYRAAELSVQQNYDWFAVQDREVERRVEHEIRRDPIYNPSFGADFGYWRPDWRYFRPQSGWQTWSPYYGDPFWSLDVDVQTIERFEVTAEITMGHGTMPSTKLHAFDARKVLARLGPVVHRPN